MTEQKWQLDFYSVRWNGRGTGNSVKIFGLMCLSFFLWFHMVYRDTIGTDNYVGRGKMEDGELLLKGVKEIAVNDIDQEKLKEVTKLDIVKRVDDWSDAAGQSVRFAQWNHPSEADKDYLTDWVAMLKALINPGCNIVDVGAHGGDTTIPLAVTARGGSVAAFEMGPPVDLLKINKMINPGLNIDIFNMAVSDHEGTVKYQSGCGGCNGGISSGQSGAGDMVIEVKSVRLGPFLLDYYGQEWLDNLCLIKLDTEGFDKVILSDLSTTNIRPPVIWTEWFAGYNFGGLNHCSRRSKELFNTCEKLGYQIFKPSLPLEKIVGCKNKFYQRDLLLVHNSYINQTNVGA